jgi:hypothetical protein
MMRIIGYALAVLLVALVTWLLYVSIDESVPFAHLELTSLRIDGRRVPAGAQLDAREDGKVLVSFSWRSHTSGARCVRVRGDLKVGVGGRLAHPVHLGGGAWTVGDGVPLPRHRCVNQAVYEIDRALAPGIVAASLGDGRGQPALISARDLLAPSTVAVTSAQPARAGERAALVALPDTLVISAGAGVVRDGQQAWPVDVDANRLSFTVPQQWAAGDAPVRVRAERGAAVVRCDRAPQCFAFGVPVDDAVPFVVEPGP